MSTTIQAEANAMTILERQIKQTSLFNDLTALGGNERLNRRQRRLPGQIHLDGGYRTQPVICRTKCRDVGLGVQALAHARCCANGCAVRLGWCRVNAT